MKKSIHSLFFLLALLIVILSCRTLTSPSSPGITASEIPPSAVPPEDTPLPVPPTSTPEPPVTDMPSPSPTLIVLPVPTINRLPQQWNGTYTYTSGSRQTITLLIENVDENTFSGKMIWQSFGNYRGAILKMSGEFVTDFGDEIEQIKWSNLDDYNREDKSGYWLKWTETEIISGSNYTVNGWYYAHIRSDGTMVAVYFFNDEETVADAGDFILEQVTP